MRRALVFVSAALLLTFGVALAQQKEAQQEAPPSAVPADDAAKKNPVKPTTEGLAEAKKLYGYHCAMCHGEKGDGKGDLADSMKLQLSDWRSPDALSKYTDGALFYIITNGRGKMVGGEGDRTKEEVRWNLVNLVRSFGKKTDEAAKQ
ncbi:MAG TPA: cytochrome c [Dongiaceae bacterium]|nr:cytochrome c [Dongiaceae bacterium]